MKNQSLNLCQVIQAMFQMWNTQITISLCLLSASSRWTVGTSPRSSMMRRLWRPLGETPLLSRLSGELPPEVRLLLHITTAAHHRRCVWWTYAHKRTSHLSTSWPWQSCGRQPHQSLISVPSFCLTGKQQNLPMDVTRKLKIIIWNINICCSVVLLHFMVVIKQPYHSVETPSIAKNCVPVISLCRA